MKKQYALLTGALFLALTPSFGYQYLAWLVPWAAVLGAAAALPFYLSSGLYLFCVYHFNAGGFPWGLADGMLHGVWQQPPWVEASGLLCWASVLWVAWRLWRQGESAS